jgi:cellulose synthase/poly-beta-1,6-N-acetylglucosamine synthase-like glycosyltransferase
MTIIFWICFITVFWCYAGYPAWMLARAVPAWRRSGAGRGEPGHPGALPAAEPPAVSVVLAVRNEAHYLERRIRNLLEQDYPGDRVEVLVVCNNCTDDTEPVARGISLRDPRVRVLTSPAQDGKAGALNVGVHHATGEVVVFADARQRFGPDVFRQLARSLEDPAVGAVSGMLRIADSRAPAVEGVRLYWGLETALRLAESRTGSVVGATGAIYAVRRHLFRPFPTNLILDDVYLPLRIAMQRRRVVLNPLAVAYDVAAADPRHEFARKLRTMVGNLQLLRVVPGLLVPTRNPILFRYVSHKLLRLVTPFCFVGMLAAALVLGGPIYGTVGLALLAMYLLGAVGLVLPLRLLAVPSAFVLIHAAVFMAMARLRQDAAGVWVPARRARVEDAEVGARGEAPVAG